MRLVETTACVRRRALRVLIVLFLGAGTAAWSESPNIVLILADDLGFADVGYHDSDIRTPHIDALARGGARLERFYALPMCTPTRAALMTGRYPYRYGLQTAAIPVDAAYGLDKREVLLPEILRAARYRTAIVGKWHLGHKDQEHWPLHRGFDLQYGPLVGEIDYYTHLAKDEPDWYDDHVLLDEDGYATELIGRRAQQVVLNHDPSNPLFLYLAFTAPHAPYQAPLEYEAQYSGIDDPTRKTYAAMVTCMDDQIGLVLDALERKGMRENTLILFMSDNGGNRVSYFSGESDVSDITLPASNAPLRGGKGTLLEGGCRVVGLLNWPGRIRPVEVAAPIHVVDILPTLANLVDAEWKAIRPIDGVDQWDVITARGEPARGEYIYNIEPYRAAIANGPWKLIVKTGIPPQIELFNIEQDPEERINRAADHPHIVESLRTRIFEEAANASPPLFLKHVATRPDEIGRFLRTLNPSQLVEAP